MRVGSKIMPGAVREEYGTRYISLGVFRKGEMALVVEVRKSYWTPDPVETVMKMHHQRFISVGRGSSSHQSKLIWPRTKWFSGAHGISCMECGRHSPDTRGFKERHRDCWVKR